MPMQLPPLSSPGDEGPQNKSLSLRKLTSENFVRTGKLTTSDSQLNYLLGTTDKTSAITRRLMKAYRNATGLKKEFLGKILPVKSRRSVDDAKNAESIMKQSVEKLERTSEVVKEKKAACKKFLNEEKNKIPEGSTLLQKTVEIKFDELTSDVKNDKEQIMNKVVNNFTEEEKEELDIDSIVIKGGNISFNISNPKMIEKEVTNKIIKETKSMNVDVNDNRGLVTLSIRGPEISTRDLQNLAKSKNKELGISLSIDTAVLVISKQDIPGTIARLQGTTDPFGQALLKLLEEVNDVYEKEAARLVEEKLQNNDTSPDFLKTYLNNDLIRHHIHRQGYIAKDDGTIAKSPHQILNRKMTENLSEATKSMDVNPKDTNAFVTLPTLADLSAEEANAFAKSKSKNLRVNINVKDNALQLSRQDIPKTIASLKNTNDLFGIALLRHFEKIIQAYKE